MNPIHNDALGDTAVNAYERLRTRILEPGVRSTDELGLAVLLRNGMLAWLRAHASVFSEVRTARDVPEPTCVSMQVHDELLQVMVAIAMLVICGKCGKRMTVRYHRYKNNTLPDYVCQREGIERAEPPCQRLPGAEIDRAVGARAVETLTPMTLELTFAVQQELEAQFERADQLRYKAVERAQYEAELARRRYLRVDPDHRLVADSLEADWNEKLRGLEHARQCYEQQRKREQLVLDENKREKLLALSTDFPKLWHDIDTPARERKRMLRLLIEDVTLHRTDQILAHVRFRGGATKTLELGRPLPAWALRQTSTQVVAAVDKLIAHHTDKEIAAILNERGMRSGEGRALHRLMVRRIRLAYGLKSRYERLREAGYLTGEEIAVELGVAVATVKDWRYKGWLRARAYDDKPHYL